MYIITHLTRPPLHATPADTLTVQIKTQTAGVTVGSRERRRDKWREREDRQGGGANIRKPQLLCVRGTHPWCALKARHYRGSQMIALAKAARLQPPQTTWQGTNSRQQKKRPTYDFFFFFAPPFSHFAEGTFLSEQHVQTCSQSSPSLFQQVKADMPTGYWEEYDKHVHAAPKLTDQLAAPA